MKIALVFASGFKRLSAHAGAVCAYQEAEEAGLVPRPSFITGASAGAIISAVFAPWTLENSYNAVKAIFNLKKSNIYSMRHLTELCGALTLGESFLNFIPPLQHDYLHTRRGQILLESVRTGLSLTTKIGLFYELLKQPSIFSNEPLRRHLKNPKTGLNFSGIWNSDIKIEIPAADLKTAKMIYFTNYLPEHRQMSNRDDALVDAICASSSVVAFLPAMSRGDYLLDDAAILNNVPIDRAILAGCEVIFVIIHLPYLQKVDFKNNKITWIDEVDRALEIACGQNTELTLRGHRQVNHDLEVIADMEKTMAEMPASERLSHLKVLLGKMSAHGLTKTKIIPVLADEPLPDLTFSKFDQSTLKRGYEIGYRAMKKTIQAELTEK